MANKNKVLFGIKNVHYSVITNGATATTYATPKALPGAVSLSIDISGDISNFFADNINYFSSVSNQGYSGSLELAKVPEQFLIDVFGEDLDDKGVLIESAYAEPKQVALMFEIDGNEEAERFVFYNVQFNRPGYSTTTIGESREPNTQTMDMTIMPSADPAILGQVKGKSTDSVDTDVYAGWYSAVYRSGVTD